MRKLCCSLAGLALLMGPWISSEARAAAQVGGSVGATADTERGASARGGGYQLPERVVAGNAISLITPFQIGMVGYLPKARFAFQYDRQMFKAHWFFAGVGLLLDRGDWSNFRMDSCGQGFSEAAGFCEKGAVVGFDLYAGYTYKWYLPDYPYVVPQARLGLGFSWWKYPNVGESREQIRDRSWTLNLRPGGGVRFFPLQDLGIGVDINLPVGFLIHTDIPMAADDDKEAGFLLGIEILPLILEYRF